MLMHYVVRTWGVSKDFVPVTEKMFIGNLLPMSWVHVFLTVLPYFEGLLSRCLTHFWLAIAMGSHCGEGLRGHGTALRHSVAIRLTSRVASEMIYLLLSCSSCSQGKTTTTSQSIHFSPGGVGQAGQAPQRKEKVLYFCPSERNEEFLLRFKFKKKKETRRFASEITTKGRDIFRSLFMLSDLSRDTSKKTRRAEAWLRTVHRFASPFPSFGRQHPRCGLLFSRQGRTQFE